MIQYFSTLNPQYQVDLFKAVTSGLPPDGGLYFPDPIPTIEKKIITSKLSFQELAYEMSLAFLKSDFSPSEVKNMIEKAMHFPVKLHPLNHDNLHILELFHGPTGAFKDFGAAYMSQLLGALLAREKKETTILVATSGDTGGAIGHGFLNVPGTRVIILYPSQKISLLQEKQLTTLGHNVAALEVKGTFDDCQAMVKKAFLDKSLIQDINLTSANSINIARLIPQSFYYAFATQQLISNDDKISFSIPSGNFGNLTAGMFAKKMGFPIDKFIASVNSNRTFLDFLDSGTYSPRASTTTISNAMDVGNPNNFSRLNYMFDKQLSQFKEHISCYSFSDTATQEAIKEVFVNKHYILDPHTAVGYLGWKAYQKEHTESKGVILATAHPAKFSETIEPVISKKIDIPPQLKACLSKEKKSTVVLPDYNELKDYLMAM